MSEDDKRNLEDDAAFLFQSLNDAAEMTQQLIVFCRHSRPADLYHDPYEAVEAVRMAKGIYEQLIDRFERDSLDDQYPACLSLCRVACPGTFRFGRTFSPSAIDAVIEFMDQFDAAVYYASQQNTLHSPDDSLHDFLFFDAEVYLDSTELVGVCEKFCEKLRPFFQECQVTEDSFSELLAMLHVEIAYVWQHLPRARPAALERGSYEAYGSEKIMIETHKKWCEIARKAKEEKTLEGKNPTGSWLIKKCLREYPFKNARTGKQMSERAVRRALNDDEIL